MSSEHPTAPIRDFQERTQEINQTLTVKNIVSILSDIASRWKEIGSFLCIDSEKLEIIGSDCGNSSRCLTEVVYHWLGCEREPNWSTIIRLVREKRGRTYATKTRNYCKELSRILDHQRSTDRHCKRLVPKFDSSYEDWWLNRIQFETDPLSRELVQKTDLKDVVCCLKEVATKWYDIGIALEIHKSVLDTIEKNFRRNTIRQLTEMITSWIDTVKQCTWRTLTNTLTQMQLNKAADCVNIAAIKNIRGNNKR